MIPPAPDGVPACTADHAGQPPSSPKSTTDSATVTLFPLCGALPWPRVRPCESHRHSLIVGARFEYPQLALLDASIDKSWSGKGDGHDGSREISLGDD